MTNQIELAIFYAVVALTGLSSVLQWFNLRIALADDALARRVRGDPARLIITRCNLRNERLRLGSHVGLFVSLGWLIVLRYVPREHQPHPLVTFGIFIAGIVLIPIMLLCMSWNVRRQRKALEALVREG